MLEYVLVSNIEEVRLKGEISDGERKLIAILYEDVSGWHLDQIEQEPIPESLVEQIKTHMQAYVNRKGLMRLNQLAEVRSHCG